MELMLTLAVAAVIMGIAVPNFTAFIRNNRLTSGANDLLASVQLARTEAIKRQVSVAVCASANPTVAVPTCSGGPFVAGWVVWVDADNDWIPDNNVNEPVLSRHLALDNTLTVRSDNNGRMRYQASGFASPASGGFTPTLNIAMCDARGIVTQGTSSTGRALVLTATGRARVTRVQTEVAAAMTTIGGSCP
jgi:type IV fimbrial biogenesis protein FimT